MRVCQDHGCGAMELESKTFPLFASYEQSTFVDRQTLGYIPQRILSWRTEKLGIGDWPAPDITRV